MFQIWANYVESEKTEGHDEEVPREEEKGSAPPERRTDFQAVVVTEVTEDLRFYVQNEEQGPKLEAMMEELRQAFTTNPPLAGAYTPKRGEFNTF
jgi:staphylococcal nuclease domain-containing protein 1